MISRNCSRKHLPDLWKAALNQSLILSLDTSRMTLRTRKLIIAVTVTARRLFAPVWARWILKYLVTETANLSQRYCLRIRQVSLRTWKTRSSLCTPRECQRPTLRTISVIFTVWRYPIPPSAVSQTRFFLLQKNGS